jgi:micrococcal nuclease
MIGALIVCATLVAVDGDTIKCDGQLIRDMGDGAPFVSGYDTGELRSYRCPEELALAKRARDRMRELIKTPGLQIIDSGEVDERWKRPLVSIRLPDGRSIGSILIAEGLAAVWSPDYEPRWCLQ